jgi:hypothetical protein
MTKLKLFLVRFVIAVASIGGGGHPAQALTVHVTASRGAIEREDSKILFAPDLRAAVEMLSDYRIAHPDSDERLEIELSPGVYRLDKPIIVTKSLSGAPGAPFRIYAKEPGTAWISGGVDLGQGAPLPWRDRKKFGSEASKHTLKYSLANLKYPYVGLFQHGSDQVSQSAYTELFFGHVPASIARWPQDGFLKIISPSTQGTPVQLDHTLPAGLFLAERAWAVGYWSTDWAMELLPVKPLRDAANSILPLAQPRRPINRGQRIYFINTPIGMMHAGDWYFDEESDAIYFWPPPHHKNRHAEISAAEHLLLIDNASNIEIDGVNFELSRGTAIVAKGVHDLSIRNCEIRNIGLNAITLEGRDSEVSYCKVHDVGSGGIVATGGDRITLTPGRLKIVNNELFRFDRFDWTYRPAVTLNGVGNQVSGNSIHDAIHSAIIVHGNDHIVQYNEIYDVVQQTTDAGAIYLGRDWTEQGTVVRFNYFHDITDRVGRGVMGVYLDDQASGTRVYGNVFYRVDTAVLVGGGRDNAIENNLAVDGAKTFLVDDRGLHWQASAVKDARSQLRTRFAGMPVNSLPYQKYRHLATTLTDQPGAPKYNVIRRNVMIRTACEDLTKQPALANSVWVGYSNNFCYERSEAFSFDAAPNANAFEVPGDFLQLPKGFLPLPLNRIGLRQANNFGDDEERPPPGSR